MKHQRGGATLAAVMVLILSGILLLYGLGQLFELRMPAVAGEIRRIRATTEAHSALAWGTTQRWQPQAHWQCRPARGGGQACLRQLERGLLLLGQDETGLLRFWQRATLSEGKVVLSPRSWSDYCPLTTGAECVP
ncbi:YgdB family protein [Enterobacteriaceae bacterium 4M9]|nr:YgdB family protein [Enterobacteriaceae bacterium 4M9]